MPVLKCTSSGAELSWWVGYFCGKCWVEIPQSSSTLWDHSKCGVLYCGKWSKLL